MPQPLNESTMSKLEITVGTTLRAPLDAVWRAYTTPDDILQWNAASDDWHTTSSSVDLRPGGRFCSRMAAKDGSVAFDFEGVYTAVEPFRLIAYVFGDRTASVHFREGPDGVRVEVTFEAESLHPPEQQREGWQAILDRFQRHVEGKTKTMPGEH